MSVTPIRPPAPRGRPTRRCPAHGLLMTGLLALSSQPVHAVYLDWSPQLRLREEYNSNVNLVREGGRSTFEHLVAPAVGLAVARHDWRLDGRLAYERRVFSRIGGLDSENWRLRLGGQVERPRDLWRIDARFEQRPTIESELLDSGLTQFSLRRTDRRIRPRWLRRLSPSSTLLVDLDYSRVGYEGDSGTTGLIDYEQFVASTTLQRDWTRTDKSLFSIALIDYRTTDGVLRVEDVSLDFQQGHVFDAKRRLALGLGLRHSRTRLQRPFTPSNSERQWGGLIILDGEWRTSRARFTGRLSRRLDPSGAGRLQTTDRLDLGYSLSVGHRLEGRLSLLVLRSRDLAGDLLGSRLDRRYYRLSPGLSWRLARAWTLRTYLSYQLQHYRRLDGSAVSRLVGLDLSYRPLVR